MKTKMLKLLFAITCLLSSANVLAQKYNFKVNGICYDIVSETNSTCAVAKGDKKYQGNIMIPSTVVVNNKKFAVVGIGDYAFASCSNLTNVAIPNSVKEIGKSAFNSCNFTEITIPNSVTTIRDGAFSGCKNLTSITIPSSVTIIEYRAFWYCSNLTKVSIPNSITIIEDEVFGGCSNLANIAIPNSVKKIGKGAFRGCGLTSITIPNSVKEIGEIAFCDCSGLTSVTIPASVTSIGRGTFKGCKLLEKIVVDKYNPNYDSRGDCNAIIHTRKKELIVGCKNTRIPDGIVSIGPDAFFGCEGLTSITIPNSVTTIGKGAFEVCGFTSITIPSSVTVIGESAFLGCGLTSITIPNSVIAIKEATFWACVNLASITISESVTAIDDDAFAWCEKLTTLYSLNPIPPSVGERGMGLTDEQYNTLKVFVPHSALAAYKNAKEWRKFKNLQGFDPKSRDSVTPVNSKINTSVQNGTKTKMTDNSSLAGEGAVIEDLSAITIPEFLGGQRALGGWIASNLKYPVVAEENGVQGRVVVSFVVEIDGSLSNIRIEEPVDPSLDKEALRLVGNMPKWIPGHDENGQPVRVKYKVPVTFRLQ